ncbi:MULTISPECIES: putative selenate ABC transporter substrate-binding protein [unclassified Mesobacillus]|uniref:putative selenate ABC transporter substrate-binding protein n=1 Tax=unclassified Mesobacillus TaxID=2675270 RepID=UPI00203EF486|nr:MULTISPECIES: putative selenate ABC transporter substrate-binding protein [unclassified Mesobacillus]MCM3121685.1 putative selenate ABC transporter substrate-binding protein [Mesobacillus sp. MER 33]MCM3231649.1 putative selenate ABC transporter substrate-binding protein [Mesobacillus sp. MER 48]
MKKLMIAAILLLTALSGCAGENTEEAKKKTIKIGAIPDQNAADLNRSMEDFAQDLGKKTGMNVEYVPSVDYSALVTAFQRGEIQLAWFGGLTGVQARNLVPEAEAFAQRPIDEKFKSVFIAQKDSEIDSLEDLKGKSFTFGSESSTSGHLMPRYFMMEAGIDADQDLDGKPNYSGSHDKTYKLVESGAYETGALNISVWEAAVKEGKVDESKVKVFYTTPEYFDYNWTVNIADEESKKKIKDAILSMTKEDNEIMELLQTDRFIETNNENYKAIEEVAKQLKIIK